MSSFSSAEGSGGAGSSLGEGQGGKADTAGEDAQEGHDDVVDEGGGDGGKGSADDDAHRHIHHVAPGDELLKFIHEFFHKACSFHLSFVLIALQGN